MGKATHTRWHASGFHIAPVIRHIAGVTRTSRDKLSSLIHAQLIEYFVPGALYGAVLGAGALQAWIAYGRSALSRARWNLLLTGGFVVLASLYPLYRQWTYLAVGSTYVFGIRIPSVFAVLFADIFAKNLPLQCALLMLFLGILMRSKN